MPQCALLLHFFGSGKVVWAIFDFLAVPGFAFRSILVISPQTLYFPAPSFLSENGNMRGRDLQKLAG